MKSAFQPLLLFVMLTACALRPEAVAQPAVPAAPDALFAAETDPTAEHAPQDARPPSPIEPAVIQRSGNVLATTGRDAYLPAGQQAEALISFLGSAICDGEVSEAVVSLFGGTRVTGSVGEAAVAVFGDLYVDGVVRGDAVAVFGNMELGPNARIDGEAIVVGGHLIRDPQALVHGRTQEIFFGEHLGRMEWLRPWLQHGLLYARPLALAPGLDWAWGLAIGFLVLYVLISLLFGNSVGRCVETLESRPGRSLVAALLTALLIPVLLLILLVTVIGIAIVPLMAIGIFCAAVFGKAVVLAALGRRVTRLGGAGALDHLAFATLVGGLILLGLYLVPVLGFIAYNVTGILGLGVVSYTLLLATRGRPGPGSGSPADTARTAGAGTSPAPEVHSAQAAPARAAAAPFAEPATPAAPAAAATPAPGPGSPPAAAGAEPGYDRSTAGTAGPDTARPGHAGDAPGKPAADTRAAGELVALPRAGFGIRMAALLLDVVLIAVIVNIVADGEYFLLLLAAYGAVMWNFKSTTIGGIICNLKVVRLDGREIGWDTAIVRALSCFLSLVFAGLGFFWILFDPERQSWHDKIAGTVVVRTSRSLSLL